MTWSAAVIAIFAAAALAAAVWNRLHARRVMKNLSRMLDAAMAGTFLEQDFDESLLSAVESRFAHYLVANAVSAQKFQEEKDKIKTLIADISHQTKTPVANILLYAQLLSEQELSLEGRDCAAALESQVEKLRALVDALVKTSRLEAGILALHPRAGPLAPMLEDTIAQFTPKAADKGITLTLSATDAQAVFDPRWTAEAVCNLLDNAVKYTPEGGNIRVSVRPWQFFTRIDISDTGMGIAAGHYHDVFKRFYRAQEAANTEGVGLGLYLARGIITRQKGYISVKSEIGKGTTFSVFLLN